MTAPPGPLPPEQRQVYLRTWRRACFANGRVEGRATEWYGNGRLAREYEVAAGQVRALKEWDERGRLTAELACPGAPDTCGGTLTRWHYDGDKAMEGAARARRPFGIWREWDPAGALVGEVDFGPDGTGREVRVGTSKRLLVADLIGDAPTVAPSDALELPRLRTARLPVLAVNLVIAKEDVVLDGEWVCDRGEADCAARLSERLAEKVAAHAALAERLHEADERPTLMVQADAATPASQVLALLGLAAADVRGTVQIVGRNPLMDLPPFDGPPRSRGAIGLASFEVPLAGLEVQGSESWQQWVSRHEP